MVILPEMWIGSPERPVERAAWHREYRNAGRELQAWCRRRRIACIFSGLERSGGRYYNLATVINRHGQVIHTYRKIHLFSLGGEARIYSPGRKVKVFPFAGGRVGVVVCYDLRFPELIRRLTLMGMTILIVPAQWPAARREHWLTLLKARAIENQVWVVGVNRLGRKGKVTFDGHSAVFDPWGRRVIALPAGRQMGMVTVDSRVIRQIRKKYPFLRERRL